MSSPFQHRHMKVIAHAIRQRIAATNDPTARVALHLLAFDMLKMLRADNSNFSKERWLRACDPDQQPHFRDRC